MKLLIEEYQYEVTEVLDVLEGLFTLQDIEGRISVSYVGYYYNPKIRDVVFILPKVLINEKGKVFGKYDPPSLIHLDEARLEPHEAKFIYEFAVWIHRAIEVYNETHERNNIILREQIQSEGNGAKRKANTWLDVILSLIRFANENQSYFTFVLKNIHSGYNKINWTRTISRTSAVVQSGSPVYLNPINKKREINFDEELIVIFFSTLKYLKERFGFQTKIPFGFPLITGGKFDRYVDGYGCRRLRQIRYKYFSDVAMRLWDLCYAFFDKAYQIKTATDNREYLLAKSFYIVFEAIIDELIGDKDVPEGLKSQADGKLVDHFYTYRGLISDREEKNDVYYIGDSKYYKIGSDPGTESVYKQYTYARNVIQWNLNLFLPQGKGMTEEQLAARRKDKGRFGKIELRDNMTEGYNVIPNFFVSANIPSNEDGTARLVYEDITKPHKTQPPISRQFTNRLYDRDTLLLSHYDVNFLFILALYARNNSGAKEHYKQSVRKKFRESIQKMLTRNFSFYAMQSHPGVNAKAYFKANFQTTLGKTFRPFNNNEIFSLALEKDDPENERIIATLRENFFVVECPLGEEPTPLIEKEIAKIGDRVKLSHLGEGKFLTCLVRKSEEGENEQEKTVKLYQLLANHEGEGHTYIMVNMPSGNIAEAKFLLPIINGGIDGYYDISQISFGTRTKTTKDGQSVSGFPTLRIKLGSFHPFDQAYTKGIVPRMANQIWNQDQLQKLITKSNEDNYNKDAISILEEPEEAYGLPLNSNIISFDFDYID